MVCRTSGSVPLAGTRVRGNSGGRQGAQGPWGVVQDAAARSLSEAAPSVLVLTILQGARVSLVQIREREPALLPSVAKRCRAT